MFRLESWILVNNGIIVNFIRRTASLHLAMGAKNSIVVNESNSHLGNVGSTPDVPIDIGQPKVLLFGSIYWQCSELEGNDGEEIRQPVILLEKWQDGIFWQKILHHCGRTQSIDKRYSRSACGTSVNLIRSPPNVWSTWNGSPTAWKSLEPFRVSLMIILHQIVDDQLFDSLFAIAALRTFIYRIIFNDIES